jgi:hypothetical protein
MAILNKINGVWREVWSSHVKIDGQWRDADVYTKIDGVWRNTYKQYLEEEDIIGFRLIYKLNINATYPLFPHLKTNTNLPVKFDIAGIDKNMNFNAKNFTYIYSNKGNAEGLLKYEGTLYAILISGAIVNISGVVNADPNILLDQKGYDYYLGDSWLSSKTSFLFIQIIGYTLYEANGYNLTGWNSIFDTREFLPPEQTLHPDNLEIGYDPVTNDRRVIIPVSKRLPTYNSIASIGIARDLKDPDHHMIGAHGSINHSIHGFMVNGVKKPFTVEIVK